ncbi:MAG: hypothetical protein QOI69_3176 [Pseudonocardiales bacterium]|nr:hypothetical protein [Pseudonocardiales bacterium]
MSVYRGRLAHTQLKERLGHNGAPDISDRLALVDPPAEGFTAAPLTGIWADPPAEVPTLQDPAAYERNSDVAYLARCPADVLDSPTQPMTPEQQQDYCKHSVDLAMRGGTTSAVVYPLAICEIARQFRIRNVGGASAGAIGAATAAAAEIGRTRGNVPEQPLIGEAFEQGRVRRGFAGLADSIAWIGEVDTEVDGGPTRYRLAQLFRPDRATLSLYRVVVAAMRKRRRALLLVAGGILSWPTRVVAGAFLIAIVLGLVWFGRNGHGNFLVQLVAALFGLLGFTIALGGSLFGIVKALKSATPEHLDLVPPLIKPPASSGKRWIGVAMIMLAVIVGGGLMVVPAKAAGFDLGRYLPALPFAWLVLVVTVLIVNGTRIYLLAFKKAKDAKYGLIGGAATVESIETRFKRFWNRVAGMAKPTVNLAVVPWLSRALSDLAGMVEDSSVDTDKSPTRHVLRFGHLWFGTDWQPTQTLKPEHVEAANEPRSRIVNLELMTSELVHGVPYRFPLRIEEQTDKPTDPAVTELISTLFLRKPDLDAVFPNDVIAVLTEGHPATAYDVTDGKEICELYPLPRPWNLPVIFAVRLSMALPALLQAVRVYRSVPYHEVRDEFGSQIVAPDNPQVSYPGGDRNREWVEPLWFTDGGVTSNFPIHFFDQPLPEWPTFGINLAPHPKGFENQDVWLPSDWQSRTSPASPLAASMVSFAGAIVNTARGWRDTTQTFMPAFRGRVAWVRQRKDEGGANLFMTPDQIASLALRGALAGARLRRRFGTDEQWRRHQWIRFRVALDNLDRLQRGVGSALGRPAYSTFVGSAALNDLETTFSDHPSLGDPDPPGRDKWAHPLSEDDFWSQVAVIRQRFANAPAIPEELVGALNATIEAFGLAGGLGDLFPGIATSTPLQTGVPYPAPALRQVPPQ